MKSQILFRMICVLFITNTLSNCQIPQITIPISAPLSTDSPGKMGNVASHSVMRIIDTKNQLGGSGFLHKSGWVITAAHVVSSCSSKELLLVLNDGRKIAVDSTIADSYLDIGLVRPAQPISAIALSLSNASELPIGAMVTTWGFPYGYNSLRPLLTVGYLAGSDRMQTPSGLSPNRWVINAAFNAGNSGGPVLDVEHGEVIGVVSSKLAPIPLDIENALLALSIQNSGFTYTKVDADGHEVMLSEGQVVAEVLKYLRGQTQLVLGHAVTSVDLIEYLKKIGIQD